MKLTTKDIIAILPFDKDFKVSLFNDFDSLDQNQGYLVAQILWKAYYSYYTLLLQENIALAMHSPEKIGITVDNTFYDQIEARTKEEMRNFTLDGKISINLEEAKEKLEKIIDMPKVG